MCMARGRMSYHSTELYWLCLRRSERPQFDGMAFVSLYNVQSSWFFSHHIHQVCRASYRKLVGPDPRLDSDWRYSSLHQLRWLAPFLKFVDIVSRSKLRLQSGLSIGLGNKWMQSDFENIIWSSFCVLPNARSYIIYWYSSHLRSLRVAWRLVHLFASHSEADLKRTCLDPFSMANKSVSPSLSNIFPKHFSQSFLSESWPRLSIYLVEKRPSRLVRINHVPQYVKNKPNVLHLHFDLSAQIFCTQFVFNALLRSNSNWSSMLPALLSVCITR